MVHMISLFYDVDLCCVVGLILVGWALADQLMVGYAPLPQSGGWFDAWL